MGFYPAVDDIVYSDEYPAGEELVRPMPETDSRYAALLEEATHLKLKKGEYVT